VADFLKTNSGKKGRQTRLDWRRGKTLLQWLIALIVIAVFNSTAMAEGQLSGSANLNRNTARQFENGRKMSDSDTFNRNFYFSFDKPVTPLLSYKLYLRTTFTDSHSTDSLGKMTSAYQRTVEPSIDLFLRNPMYSFDAGYRRNEQWSTAHLRDEGRKTTDYYYSRLNITPYEFPSLLLQFDRQRDNDYVSPNKIDSTNTKYSGSTGYKFPYRDLDLSYNLYYTRTTTDTPLSLTFKSVSDNFSGIYNIGYTKSFIEGKYTASAVYQGNYARNKSQQFVTNAEKTTNVSTSFNQGLNFNVNARPAAKLNSSLTYNVNKTDTNPISPLDSIAAFGGDIFTKSAKNQKTTMKSTITKTYGISSTWTAHRLLSTTARAQRSVSYDNMRATDSASNTYSLTFSSAPLPTLNTNLSFTRSDSFNFGIKQSTNDSALLNIGSRLYRDVNMTTDIGFGQSTVHTTNAQSSTRHIRNLLDITLTPKLFGTLTYGFTNTSTGSTTQEGGTVITYRPGRFVNVSGTFSISDIDGNASTSEGLTIDWLPLPAIKLNLSYRRTDSQPGPMTSDAFNTYVMWRITKFMDLQATYNYTLKQTDKKTQIYNFGLNLNCRFW